FHATNTDENAVTEALHELLEFGLIEPYDASEEGMEPSQRVAITHSGRMHYELATTDPIYVAEMAFATPVRGTALADSLRALRSKKMTAGDWHEVRKKFVAYCLEQDDAFLSLPADEIYDGQRQLREDIKGRWISRGEEVEETDAGPASPVEARGVNAGFSHLPTVVSWYNADRGYGFVEGGLGEGIFLHHSVLRQAEVDSVKKGDTLVCDVAPG